MSKQQLINYLVDTMGYSEDTLRERTKGELKEWIKNEPGLSLTDCKNYNK